MTPSKNNPNATKRPRPAPICRAPALTASGRPRIRPYSACPRPLPPGATSAHAYAHVAQRPVAFWTASTTPTIVAMPPAIARPSPSRTGAARLPRNSRTPGTITNSGQPYSPRSMLSARSPRNSSPSRMRIPPRTMPPRLIGGGAGGGGGPGGGTTGGGIAGGGTEAGGAAEESEEPEPDPVGAAGSGSFVTRGSLPGGLCELVLDRPEGRLRPRRKAELAEDV